MAEPSQSFSRRQLGWMRRWHSQAHLRTESGTRPVSNADWTNFLTEIERNVAADAFSFRGLRWHRVNSKQALSTSLLEDTLVIRKMNDNIRRSYGLTQPSRTSLIRTGKQALSENAPKSIIRIDLKSCFESINREMLLKQLRAEAHVSSQTTALLNILFARAANRCPDHMPHGVPRGLSISTSLAELKLRALDQEIRAIPGVYLLLRYVDDILIFSTSDASLADKRSREIIGKHGFRVNEKKSSVMRVACKCEKACTHGNNCPCKKSCKCITAGGGATNLRSLEYLGYKLMFYPFNAKTRNQPNEVYCVLSERKTTRIKSRIWKAIHDCKKTSDWRLLENRIQYLTSNQLVAAEPGKRGLFSGLSYTHTEYTEPAEYKGGGSLKDLDQFYRARLRTLLSAAAATPYNAARLERLSFESGFRNRRRTKFTPLRVNEIQKCWSE